MQVSPPFGQGGGFLPAKEGRPPYGKEEKRKKGPGSGPRPG